MTSDADVPRVGSGSRAPGGTGKLPRAQRREQILAVATTVFGDAGYGAAGLELIATEAGISRMILYRHFESKADLYRAAMARAADRLATATGDHFGEHSVRAMLAWAAAEPDEFDLLFRQAAREPEFRSEAEAYTTELVAEVEHALVDEVQDPRWARWAGRVSLAITVEAIAAWLDVGRPEPEQAVRGIEATVATLVAQARAAPRTPRTGS